MKLSGASLSAAAVGFAVSFACCLPFVIGDDEPPATGDTEAGTKNESRVRSRAPKVRISWITDTTDPQAVLSFGGLAGSLSPKEREENLALLLELPEDERREALTILMPQLVGVGTRGRDAMVPGKSQRFRTRVRSPRSYRHLGSPRWHESRPLVGRTHA